MKSILYITDTVVLVEHMNDNDLRNTSVEQADGDYARLMAEAYPGPKTDIRGAVMARIAEEEKQSYKKEKKLIWTAGNRNRFVRWGGMAACLVLLVSLGLRVLPMMMKDAVVEEAANTTEYADAETMTETAAVSEAENSGSSGFFKSQLYSNSEPIEEEIAEEPAAREETVVTEAGEGIEEEALDEAAVMTVTSGSVLAAIAEDTIPEAVAEEEVVEEAAAEKVAPIEELMLPEAGEILVEEEAAVEESVMEEVPEEEAAVIDDGNSLLYGYAGSLLTSNHATFYDGSSGSGVATVPKSLSYTAEGCLHSAVFGNSFHDIPQAVVNLVTSCADVESVAVWCSENAGTCGMNIYELLTAFSIPRDSFEELYTTTDLWYHHDYSVDLLFGGDRDAAYQYYLNGGDYAGFVKRYFEYELKLDLYAEAGSKAYNAWAAGHGFTSFCQWSLAEFVQDFGVTQERFAELYDALVMQFAETYAGYAVAEYDFDKIYGTDADVADSIARSDMGYVTDAMCHK